ncbi:DUF6085 family protein [Streptomyces sp. KL116D]|uniref:DUF6085 family protein n=1 Tax=Streptomyces sp. KL116D TaxID=3045152 RepID=UPI003558D7F2
MPVHLPDGVTVQPGQQVIAFESEDQVAAPAVVRRLEHGHAHLDVDWGAMRDDQPGRDETATQATGGADEAVIARAIGDFVEHLAHIPPNLKARAVNAVGPALQAHGEWLRLSTRQTVAVAVLLAVKAELEAAADLPDVDGQCPACGGESLMLADGGYVTCRRADCPDPTAAHDAIEERAGANAYDRAINTPPSAAALEGIRKRLADGTAPRRTVPRTTLDNPPTSSDAVNNPQEQP